MPTTASRSQSALVAALAGAALGLTVSYSPEAYAASFSGTGSGFDIFDFNAAASTITFTDNSPITNITVTLVGLQHTFIGDLNVTLRKDDGIFVRLFSRVGNGGASSDLNGNYSFNDAFTGNLWTTAASGSVIPPGNYFPTGADGALASPSLSAFNGQNLAGNWSLLIADNKPGDQGRLGSWQLTINDDSTAIPTPAMLPGLIGMGLSFYRKRRADGVEVEAEV